MMPEDNAAAIRRIMDRVFLNRPLGSMFAVFDRIKQECAKAGLAFSDSCVLEYWANLVRVGAIAVWGGYMDEVRRAKGGEFICPYSVTERGRKLLERGEQSPHDPARYFLAVRKRVQAPDEIALAYLNEAVDAWAAGLNRASAIMLGCACERLVLVLAQAVAAAGVSPWHAKITKELQAIPSRISILFEEVRKCLAHLAGDKKLPGELADALDRKLSAIFDHARGLRNKSGHPTGAAVSADDAEAGLLLFPGFYAFVNDLCASVLPTPTGQN